MYLDTKVTDTRCICPRSDIRNEQVSFVNRALQYRNIHDFNMGPLYTSVRIDKFMATRAFLSEKETGTRFNL